MRTPVPLKGNWRTLKPPHIFRPLSKESGDSLLKPSCGVTPAEWAVHSVCSKVVDTIEKNKLLNSMSSNFMPRVLKRMN